MLYEDLHQRFGSHIAKRVQVELSASEFKQVDVEGLVLYLETRAEIAHKEYQSRVDNPFSRAKDGNMDALYQRWRDAEDLAYLVMVAEDVGTATRLVMANGKA